jgi:hypothetical protein
MKNYTTLVQAMDDLRKRGYDADFEPHPYGLYSGDLDLRLDHEDFNVDEVYHFKENSNAVRNTDLYAISSITGVRGILIDGDDPNSDPLHPDLVRKLQNSSSATGVTEVN